MAARQLAKLKVEVRILSVGVVDFYSGLLHN